MLVEAGADTSCDNVYESAKEEIDNLQAKLETARQNYSSTARFFKQPPMIDAPAKTSYETPSQARVLG
jgi:hypothetical protein